MSKKRKDKVIKLVGRTNSSNDAGDTIKTPAKRTVFAEEKSVTRKEFYEAAATGFRPEVVLTIWQREYNGEEKIEYNGIGYKIIRSYKPNSEDIELTCSALVNKGAQQI